MKKVSEIYYDQEKLLPVFKLEDGHIVYPHLHDGQLVWADEVAIKMLKQLPIEVPPRIPCFK